MKKRATIQFSAHKKTVYICCFFEDLQKKRISSDLISVIKICKNRWNNSELGQFTSFFLGKNFDKHLWMQHYELTHGFSDDDFFRCYVRWDYLKKEYIISSFFDRSVK